MLYVKGFAGDDTRFNILFSLLHNPWLYHCENIYAPLHLCILIEVAVVYFFKFWGFVSGTLVAGFT